MNSLLKNCCVDRFEQTVKILRMSRRALLLSAVLLSLLGLFVYVGFRSGPLAPVRVTLATVESRALKPSLFGVGSIEAQHSYRIGPTLAGRIKSLTVQVGERVQAGQLLGEMDPVDLDDRLQSQMALVKRTEAGLREAEARQAYAQSQIQRYEKLRASHLVSEEAFAGRQQEALIAEAALDAAREELVRARSDSAALQAQSRHLRLIAPASGMVIAREAEPGASVGAGQLVLEIVEPASMWINVRFDQRSAAGLAAGLPAKIVLRSRSAEVLTGRVLRVEPRADAVTEETLAKIVFEVLPATLPPLGELAEVTLDLPALPATPVIPNAAVQRHGERAGVWRIAQNELQFSALTLGASTLNGEVQVQKGLQVGDQIVVYSEKALSKHSRVQVVKYLPGVSG